MSSTIKVSLPVLIAFFFGMFIIFEYYFLVPSVSAAAKDINQWAVAVDAAAMGVGIVTLLRIHGRHIARRTAGQWYNSAALVAMLLLFPLLEVIGATEAFRVVYMTVNVPLMAGFGSSYVFYNYSAMYRALKATRLNAFLLLVAGTTVLMMNAPIGAVIWSGFPVVGRWMMDVANNSVMRGLTIGAGLGAIALGVRTLLGMERGYLGRG